MLSGIFSSQGTGESKRCSRNSGPNSLWTHCRYLSGPTNVLRIWISVYITGKEWGNIGGYPILCLHGFVDNCDSFAPLAPHLSDKFHYIALDAYGHGLTSHVPLGAPMNYWDLVISVRRAVEHFGLQKVSIIGHSMGGSTGMLYASIYPENVDRLLMLDIQKPVCLPLPWHTQSIAEAIELYLNYEKKVTCGKSEKGCSVEELVQRYVQSMNGTISPEAVRLLMKRGSKPSGEGYVYAHDTRVVIKEDLSRLAFEKKIFFLGTPNYTAFHSRRTAQDNQRTALSREDCEGQTRAIVRVKRSDRRVQRVLQAKVRLLRVRRNDRRHSPLSHAHSRKSGTNHKRVLLKTVNLNLSVALWMLKHTGD